MSRFLVSREFVIPEITYNIGHLGDNIGRVGDTVATDSVVMEDSVHKENPIPELHVLTTGQNEEE